MCENVYADPNPEQPLARLIERELKTKIDPIALRLFIRQYWYSISVLAHHIHEDGMRSAGTLTKTTESVSKI